MLENLDLYADFEWAVAFFPLRYDASSFFFSQHVHEPSVHEFDVYSSVASNDKPGF